MTDNSYRTAFRESNRMAIDGPLA